ncbi:MAG: EamA family transporter [Pseudomonadota bacterium]|nr:EamA family transporter [Pseudomonadota bacterium]MDQ3229316.1 EamA family transporter [Pseudomonadota bacterium]
MTATTHWMYWAALSAVFAAMTAVFAKAGLQEVDADFATLLRTGFVLVLLAVFVAVAGKWRSPATLTPTTWGWLLASALATAASWLCYFRALKLGDASKVAAVDKLSLLLVAVFAFVFLHERLNLREWVGVALMTGGALLLAIKR